MALTRWHVGRSLTTRWLLHTLVAMVLGLAARPAAAQNQLWVRQFGTSSGEFVHASAPDAAGGAYLAGQTWGSLGGPFAGGFNDAWLARHDGAGNQLWIRQLGGIRTDVAFALAPDDASGVYVAGYTAGSLGGAPLGGLYDAWLARYDTAGNQLWIRQFGTNKVDGAYALAADGSGGVFVAGETEGNLGAPNAGSSDAWLARYDSAGNQLWVRQLGTSQYEQALGAAPDGSGGVHVNGVSLGGLGGPNAGVADGWLARYDGAGNQLWIHQLGTSGIDIAASAAEDTSGGVYVSGYTEGSLAGPHAGGQDAWLARYDSAGNQLWIRQLGSSGPDSANAAAPDGSGGVYFSGSTTGSFGGPNAGKADAWLARYDSAGNQLWIEQLGTSQDDLGSAAAPDGLGGLYVSGRTYGSLGGPHLGNADVWLARYELCGSNSTYCTAKTNSAGCPPSIAASGNPSASAGSGFTITTSNVLDNEFGLYFYSKSGPINVLFQGGFLCAQPPLVRTMLQNSGGTPPCGGSFQIDFNAYIASGKDPALVAGQKVWLQAWSRDPGFAPPNNTSLSDAVSSTICP